jgi:hypothetical protein
VFEDGTGQMKVHCSKTHKYLGMSLDFSHANQCRVTMIDYVDEIVVAYDKALAELSDGFSAVKKKLNIRLVWATKAALSAICLVFPALVLGYYLFIVECMTYQFFYRLKNLYDYCWQQ